MGGKDLAGIAALGALGYMLANKGKKGSDVDTSKVSDMDLTGGARSPAMPMGDMKDTEFGDLAGAQDAASSRAVMDQFNQNQRAPSKSSLKTVKNAVRSGAMDTGGFEGVGSSMSKPKEAVDLTKLSLAERREMSKREDSGSGPTDSRSVNERLRSSLGFSKGGKVIKMAKGGMTSSASSRADGIAQKGKTRGKMC